MSIIIVSFNTRELLCQCLASVRRFSPTAQVVVVDNASRDGSVGMVHAEFPEVKVLALAENLGFAAANNEGLKVAFGDPIVLLNSDTVVEDDSLDRCAAWMRDQPRVGALSPRLIDMNGQPQDCLRPFPTLARLLRVAFWGQPLSAGEKGTDGWLAGTALFLRRQALIDIGGQLDARYFMYWEDADLSARLRERGWERVVHPSAHVRHYGGSSSGAVDSPLRAELLAWDLYGRHCWFTRHRPALEAIGLWMYDALDIPRTWLRGWRRRLRTPRIQAGVLLKVLLLRLFGRRPPRPS